MEITFVLPVKNARKYFDPNHIWDDKQLIERLSSYGLEVVEKCYESFPSYIFSYQFDLETLGGKDWLFIQDEYSSVPMDYMLEDGLNIIADNVWDSQEF